MLFRSASRDAAIQAPPAGVHDHLHHCADTLMSLLGRIRETVDGLELLVDDDIWPLPTYQEMLFVR